jgi:hypothetical protein
VEQQAVVLLTLKVAQVAHLFFQDQTLQLAQ